MITKVHFDHIRDTIIPPHSISTLSSRLAVSLLRDAKLLNYFNNINKYIINCRKYLYKNLNIKYKECTIYNSESNFLTIQFRSIVNYMKFYMKIKDFPGIQCFEEKKFIKIWITNMDICQKIVNAIND